MHMTEEGTHQVRNKDLLANLERHVRVRDRRGLGCGEGDNGCPGDKLGGVLLGGHDNAVS